MGDYHLLKRNKINEKELEKMSDYHILRANIDLRTIDVVFHIPIPDTDNFAGVSFREALVRDQGGADNIVSVLPELVGTQEETDLKAGALLEYTETFRFSSINLTNVQRRNEVANRFTTLTTDKVDEIHVTHNFYGYHADV
jgi:hypothetical protein